MALRRYNERDVMKLDNKQLKQWQNESSSPTTSEICDCTM